MKRFLAGDENAYSPSWKIVVVEEKLVQRACALTLRWMKQRKLTRNVNFRAVSPADKRKITRERYAKKSSFCLVSCYTCTRFSFFVLSLSARRCCTVCPPLLRLFCAAVTFQEVRGVRIRFRVPIWWIFADARGIKIIIVVVVVLCILTSRERVDDVFNRELMVENGNDCNFYLFFIIVAIDKKWSFWWLVSASLISGFITLFVPQKIGWSIKYNFSGILCIYGNMFGTYSGRKASKFRYWRFV